MKKEFTEYILKEVAEERTRQPDHLDHTHKPLDWHEMIADYNAWARRKYCQGKYQEARRKYVQIAALAVAAAEEVDRKWRAEE